MKKNKKIFMLEWKESMGPEWMNTDNLKSLMFSKMASKPDLIKVTDVTEDIFTLVKNFTIFLTETINTSADIMKTIKGKIGE